MYKSVLKTISQYNMLVRGERVVCAVSGGADSVAMLRALCILKQTLGVEVFACHLNHGLRGEESKRDEIFVADLCEKLNVPCYIETTEIKGKTAVEEKARKARYEFFERAMEKFHGDKLATAHNAEDNLETLIFHLARGSGLDGLCGIPPVRDKIIRPLIFTRRAEITEFLNEIHQNWVEDSTNAGDEYTRNLIRHKILPVLEEINSAAVANATRTIKTISEDGKYLNDLAKDMAGSEEYLDISLASLPDALLSRIIRIKCEEKVKNRKQVLDFSKVCDIINLMRSEKTRGSLSVSKDLQVYRIDSRIYFAVKMPPIGTYTLKKGESITVGEYKITCKCDSVLVRCRRDGDKIKLAGRRTRLIKKILCDAKVPQFKRDFIPIIEKNGRVIALCGFGTEKENLGDVDIEHA